METIIVKLQIASIVMAGRTAQTIAPMVEKKQLIQNIIWIVKSALIIKTQMGF